MNKSPFTICIPIRIDSEYRLQNLKTAVAIYSVLDNVTFIILEADVKSKISGLNRNDKVKHIFIPDENPVFYRTKYINEMLRIVDTEIAVVLDTDIIMPPYNLSDAVDLHYKNRAILSLPYDGRCFLVTPYYTEFFHMYHDIKSLEILQSNMTLLNGFKTVGGIYIVNVEKYMHVGMENEHFSGWGPEDAERVHRLEILGYKINRFPGAIYHLYHPRLRNSDFYDDKQAFIGKNEHCYICSLSKEQLMDYISNWPWIRK